MPHPLLEGSVTGLGWFMVVVTESCKGQIDESMFGMSGVSGFRGITPFCSFATAIRHDFALRTTLYSRKRSRIF